ncbi:MAG TPA: glycosyltransferase family 2 protein [Ktedonobacteraceae bacterium]|nr:glycosyltransferase family 2 protein [Ktedonobacteraceae bacterium]
MLTAPAVQAASIIDQAAENMPVLIQEIELSHPLPVLSASNAITGLFYRSARCLIRLHDQPLGIVEVLFEQESLAASDYMQQIWNELRIQINEHLRQDGLPSIAQLEPGGVSSSTPPACIQEREAFTAYAPFVSIIVSTHNRPESLSACLPMLVTQRYPNYEVLIVDNAPSNSATADLIQQNYTSVAHLRYVREDRPGLSRGLNRGIAEARGEILAFTDDDVIVDSYWLLQLVQAFNLADKVACVTGLVLPQELETPAQFWFEEYGGFSKGFQRRIYDMGEHHTREPLYPYTAGRFGTGASMAFRSAFLKSCGGFDLALQAGMDIAAFFQVIRQGYQLVYEPAALAHHTHRRSYSDLQRQIYSYGVALTAYLTKNILDNPRLLFELLIKIPYGFFFTLSVRSPKNKKKSPGYPKKLTQLELRGLLCGPFVYIWRRSVLTFTALSPHAAQENRAQ